MPPILAGTYAGVIEILAVLIALLKCAAILLHQIGQIL